MNLQEFFEQAHYFRTWTPTKTGTDGTVGTFTVNDAVYAVIGRLVVCLVDISYAYTVAPTYITISLPIPMRVWDVSVNLFANCGFTGIVDQVAAYGFHKASVAPTNTDMAIFRYDQGVYTTGAQRITGLVFYQNGEPVV